VLHLYGSTYLIFPIKEGLFISRGILIEIADNGTFDVKKIEGPPEKIMRPGVSVQDSDLNEIKVLLLGGNEAK
jgi:hypothetical protein